MESLWGAPALPKVGEIKVFEVSKSLIFARYFES